MSLPILFIYAIILTIILSLILKVNIGYIALILSFIIGIFVMDKSASQVIASWPISLFFRLFAVTFFYGFAIVNGTIDLMGRKLVYMARNFAPIIPYVLWVTAFIIGGMGAGPFAVLVFLTPMVMSIATQIGMPKLLGSAIILFGASAGSFTPISMGGMIVYNICNTQGFPEMADTIIYSTLRNVTILHFIMFTGLYIITKCYKLSATDLERPQAFNQKQRTTLILIIASVILVIVPPFLASIFPGISFLTYVRSKMDIMWVCTLAAILGMVFKIGTEEDALKMVPMSTIILVCGMGVMIDMAAEAGFIDTLIQLLQANVASDLVKYIITLIAAVMSLFSSSFSVVIPTLGQLVFSIGDFTSMAPAVLFSYIAAGAMFAGFSPFSDAGAICIANMPEAAERKRGFWQQFVYLGLGLMVMQLLIFLRILR